MHIISIFRIISFLVVIVSLFLFSCLFFASSSKEFYILFIISISSFLFGLLSIIFTRKKIENLSFKDSFIIVSFSWVIISLFGSLPYYFLLDVSFVDAFFETISGFTTTGASIFPNVEILPKSILYWRSLTNWLGGMGVIVLTLAILPFVGGGSIQLYKAEAPGIQTDRLTSRIKDTSKQLWFIYLFFTFFLFFILKLLGLNWFDSICHAFATMATGGFSTKNASIMAFSPAVQFTITIFMFIGACNFILHNELLRYGKFLYFKSEEFLFFLLVILTSTLLISLYLQGQYPDKSLFSLLNISSFQVVSIISTTGFSSDNFNLWGNFPLMILFSFYFYGGCGGSTGGGIKICRILTVIKFCLFQIKKNTSPRLLMNLKIDKIRLSESIILKVFAFIFIYFFIYITITITLFFIEPNITFKTAFSVSIACLGNIGPGLSQVGPVENYAWLSDSSKYLLSFVMLIGRLELFTVLSLFVPNLWKKRGISSVG